MRENVALVTDIASDPMPVDEALELVALAPRRDHFPSQLSGGEQQRVAIARAIVKRPQLLLCDEPTGALDYATGKLVLEVIARINLELGTTAIVITHNAAIAGMADRVIRLADGRIASIESAGAAADAGGTVLVNAMKALDRKVLRDLRLLWSQALTIALVVASGIGGFIAMPVGGGFAGAARATRFYESGRFADVFATVKRAPDALAQRLAELPGVVDVQPPSRPMARVTVPGSAGPGDRPADRPGQPRSRSA